MINDKPIKSDVAPRWYGAAIGIIVFVGFAAYSRDRIGAVGRVFPDTRPAMWGLLAK